MVNIALVGLGFMGRAHIEAYKDIDACTIKAIYTRSGKVDDEVTEGFNGYVTSQYEDILTDPDIDVIDICLPTFLHEEFIVKSAKAGKHIICEKPLTLTSLSAKRMIDVAKENNIRLFVGHILRFWPEYQKIKQLSEQDELKDIEMVHAKRLGQVPNWSNWFQHPDKSGGALYDLHIHDIDFTNYLLGEVSTVYAVGSKNEHGAWNQIMTTLTYRGGGKAFIEASHRMPNHYPFTMSYRAQNKHHTVEFSVKAGENIEHIESGSHAFTLYSEENNMSLLSEENDPFYNELAYFINCIKENKPNKIIPLSDVVYTLEILEAIETSLQTEQIVRI